MESSKSCIPLDFRNSTQTIVEKCKHSFRSESYRCIQAFNNFLYYLCLTPCKIVASGCPEKVRIVPATLFRKILVVTIQLCCNYLVSFLNWLHAYEGVSISKDPSVLYSYTSFAAYTVSITLWPLILYFKKDAFVRLVESSFLLQNNTQPLSGMRFWKAGQARWIIGNCIIMCTLSVIYKVSSGEDLYDVYLKSFMHTFCAITSLSVTKSFTEIVIQTIAIYANLICWAVFFLPPICASLVVHNLSKELTENLSHSISSGTFDIEETICIYKDIKRLLSELNEITSAINLCFLLNMTAESCTNFTGVWDDEASKHLYYWNSYIRYVTIAFFSVFCMSMWIAAAAHEKFRRFGELLYLHIGGNLAFSHGVKIELSLLQNDLMHHPLGLKVGKFVVSYSVLASALGATLTYVFVFLQFTI